MEINEKQFLVSKQNILSEVAKWAVAQSPYHRPDNFEIVLDKLNEGFGKWNNKNLGYERFTYKKLMDFLGRELKKIPEFLLWNEKKNGNQNQYKFIDRYSKNDNPDDDFIDLDALIRNVANSIIREGTEVSIPEILGEPKLYMDKFQLASCLIDLFDEYLINYKTMTNQVDNGFEPYIPSVHFKNISPNDFLITEDGEDFIKKLEEYESLKTSELERLYNELIRLQNACATIYYAAQAGMKCGH